MIALREKQSGMNTYFGAFEITLIVENCLISFLRVCLNKDTPLPIVADQMSC